MEIQLAVLADSANVSREGKLNILGEFDTLWARQVPVRWPLMFFVAKLRASVAEADAWRFSIRIVDGDGNLAAVPVDFEATQNRLPDPGMPHVGHIVVGIEGAVFKDYGTYDFELVANGDRVCTVPLHVREPRPPNVDG